MWSCDQSLVTLATQTFWSPILNRVKNTSLINFYKKIIVSQFDARSHVIQDLRYLLCGFKEHI